MKCPSKTLTALAVTAFLAPIAADAAKVNVKISGQINRAATYADNDIEDDVVFVDNNASGTRIRLTGDTELPSGNKAGVHWETQYQDNSSSAIDVDSGDSSSEFNSRFREIWFSGAWGKLYLGQGNGAANGTAETDLSGTFIINNADTNLGDGISFRATGPGVDNTGAVVVRGDSLTGSNVGGFDGLSRNDRVRYDTPKLGPLVLSGDVGQDKFELAARMRAEVGGGGTFAWAASYYDSDDNGVGGDRDAWVTSASVLFGNGFNVTGGIGKRKPDAGTDSEWYYVKVGQMFGADHAHKVVVSYRQKDDFAQAGDEVKEYGLGYLYNMDDYGVELYAGVYQRELDRPGVPVGDITLVHAGSRIKF